MPMGSSSCLSASWHGHGCAHFLPILEFRNTIRLNVIRTQISLRCNTYIATSHWNHDYSVNKSVENDSFLKNSPNKNCHHKAQKTTNSSVPPRVYMERHIRFVHYLYRTHEHSIHWQYNVDMCIIFRAFFLQDAAIQRRAFQGRHSFYVIPVLDRRWGQLY